METSLAQIGLARAIPNRYQNRLRKRKPKPNQTKPKCQIVKLLKKRYNSSVQDGAELMLIRKYIAPYIIRFVKEAQA